MNAPRARNFWDPWGRFVGSVQASTRHVPVMKPLVGAFRLADAFAAVDCSYDVLDVERFSVRCGVADDLYRNHDRAHLMESAIRDATMTVGESVERYVYATPPGTLVCVHHPETVIADDPWRARDGATVQRDVHHVQYRSGRYRPCPTGSGGRQVYRSPWPCAFCHRRTAVDYVRACDDCYASYASGWSSVAQGEGWYYLMRCGLTPLGLPLGRRHLGLSAAPPLFGGLMLQMVTDGSLS